MSYITTATLTKEQHTVNIVLVNMYIQCQNSTPTLNLNSKQMRLWGSYVYWTMHHLDSWIKRDQLHVTCFIISLFNAQHVSDVNSSILATYLLSHFMGCIALVRCVLVLRCGLAGVLQCFSLHADTTPPQPNHTVTQTHIEPEQYNLWNNSSNKSLAPEDGCINIRNMLSIK